MKNNAPAPPKGMEYRPVFEPDMNKMVEALKIVRESRKPGEKKEQVSSEVG